MAEQRDRGRERLVRIAVAENPVTAELIRETLAAAGIRSTTRNQDTLSSVYGSPPSPWALEVWVLEGDADAASALLGGTARTELPPPAVTPPARKRRRWWLWKRI